MSRGFLVIEVAVAYVLLTLALVALLPVFILAIRAGASTARLEASTYLSQELLEEIRLRKWDKTSPATPAYIASPSLITVTTETNKTNIVDIGSFNGWTEAAVQDPLGNPVTALSAYSRTVSVVYVSSTSFDVALGPSFTSDYKKVTVCSQTGGVTPLCLSTVFANR